MKQEKDSAKAKFEEWYGIEYDEKLEKEEDDGSEESSSFTDSSDGEEDAENEQLSSNAKMFYDNPVFKSLEKEKPGIFEKEIQNMSEESSDENDELSALRKSKKRKRSKDSKDKKKEETEIEIVPLEKEISDDDGMIC